MDLNEAKQILKNAGYIVEDTDDWDEADMSIGTPKQRADRVNKHSSFRDLDHKYTDAANFNIKNLFYGYEQKQKRIFSFNILTSRSKENCNRILFFTGLIILLRFVFHVHKPLQFF